MTTKHSMNNSSLTVEFVIHITMYACECLIPKTLSIESELNLPIGLLNTLFRFFCFFYELEWWWMNLLSSLTEF